MSANKPGRPPTGKPHKGKVNLTLDSSLLVALKEAAWQDRRSLSAYVENALVRHFEGQEVIRSIGQFNDKYFPGDES